MSSNSDLAENSNSGIDTAASADPHRFCSREAHLDSLRRLSGGVAHDFNNLLTGILGYADLALFGVAADSPIHRHLEQIRTGARKANELTQLLLSYCGKGPLLLQPVDLSELTANKIGKLRGDLPSACVLKLDLASGMKPIQGDVEQLGLVVAELLQNAVDALGGQAGAIHIRTGTKSCDASYFARCVLGDEMMPGEYAFLEMVDSGCGIESESRDKIFEPFFTTTGRKGLGLSRVFGLVCRHAGNLLVAGQPGKGATFRLYFPIGRATSK